MDNIIGDFIIRNKQHQKVSDSIENPLPVELRTIYEVFRVDNGIPLFLEEHLQRLLNGLNNSGIEHSFEYNKLSNEIHLLIQENNLSDCNIKISCFCDLNKLTDYIIHYIPSRYPTPEMYKKGINTILHEGIRMNPGIKQANTTVRKSANKEIEEMHAFEALLANNEGFITEGSRSNVFFIKDNTIYTAPENLILPGIMRSRVISLIHSNHIELKEECANISDLQLFESAFMTGTSPRILPIKKIEDFNFNVDHPLLRTLMNKLDIYIQEYKKRVKR